MHREGLYLSAADQAVRQRTVECLAGYLDVAKRSDEPDYEVAKRRVVDCLQTVGAIAESKGVELVFEPASHLQSATYNTVEEVRQLIQEIDCPVCKLVLDTVHMNVEERSLTQHIYDCGPLIRHVHLCESNGAQFGSGHIDFEAVLKALEDIG